MDILSNLPIPYFILDQNFKIIQKAKVVHHLFPETIYFTDLIDTESKEKVASFLRKDKLDFSFEANLFTIHEKVVLFDLKVTTDVKGFIHVAAIEKSGQYQTVYKQMKHLREQIEFTSFANTSFVPKIKETNEEKNNLEMIKQKIETVEELLRILRPDFIESYKSEYIEILLEQLNDIQLLLED